MKTYSVEAWGKTSLISTVWDQKKICYSQKKFPQHFFCKIWPIFVQDRQWNEKCRFRKCFETSFGSSPISNFCLNDILKVDEKMGG